jgi:hypothetical protein
MRRYGLGAAEIDAMVAAQGGLSAICRKAPAEHVDHCHKTGKVRAVLCFGCNGGLGQFRDDPRALRQAIAYLTHYRSAHYDGPKKPGQWIIEGRKGWKLRA